MPIPTTNEFFICSKSARNRSSWFSSAMIHAACDYTFYVSSGKYLGMQLRAAFGAGKKYAKELNSKVSDGEGALLAKTLGWVIGISIGMGVRLEFGVLMLPIQAIAALSHPSRHSSGIGIRISVLAIWSLAAIVT